MVGTQAHHGKLPTTLPDHKLLEGFDAFILCVLGRREWVVIKDGSIQLGCLKPQVLTYKESSFLAHSGAPCDL